MNGYILYAILINTVSFMLFYIDKKKAKKHRWRIKESTLHLSSFLGGALGSILAMIMFHHKTRKPKFYVITFVSLAFNIFLAYVLKEKFFA